MKRLFALMLCLLLSSFFSCDKNDGEVVLMTVASKKGIVSDPVSTLPREVFLVKEKGEVEWSYFYDEIEGFKFEEGYECRLLVAVISISHPMMDASSAHYKMVQLLSKTEKDSEGL